MPKSCYVSKELGSQLVKTTTRGHRGTENASKRLLLNLSSQKWRLMSKRAQVLRLQARRQRLDEKLLQNLARRAQSSKQSRKQKHRKRQTQNYRLQVRLQQHQQQPSHRRNPRLRLQHQLLLPQPMLTGSCLVQPQLVPGTRELPNRQKSKSRKLLKIKET